MTSAIILLILAAIGGIQAPSERGITIINKIDRFYEQNTKYTPPDATELGPMVGGILLVHYFPALRHYEIGWYEAALGDITYVVQRPDFLRGNPNQANYMSNGHYLRGMIFFYHAEGGGRLLVAKSEFEKSIKWNPNNYVAYLELSRLYTMAGLGEQAVTVLKQLIDLNPDQGIAAEARKELEKLKPGDTK